MSSISFISKAIGLEVGKYENIPHRDRGILKPVSGKILSDPHWSEKNESLDGKLGTWTGVFTKSHSH